jgi:hypothetical protein
MQTVASSHAGIPFCNFRFYGTLFIHIGTFKGIVSRDFGTRFLISLARFEGRNRAGAGLFFILITFSPPEEFLPQTANTHLPRDK